MCINYKKPHTIYKVKNEQKKSREDEEQQNCCKFNKKTGFALELGSDMHCKWMDAQMTVQ